MSEYTEHLVATFVEELKRKSQGIDPLWQTITGLPSCDRLLVEALPGRLYAIMGETIKVNLLALQCAGFISLSTAVAIVSVRELKDERDLERFIKKHFIIAKKEGLVLLVVGLPEQEHILELDADVLFSLVFLPSLNTIGEIRLLKNRYGPRGVVRVQFSLDLSRFVECPVQPTGDRDAPF